MQPIVQLEQLGRMAVVGEANVDLPTFVLGGRFMRHTRAYPQQKEGKKPGLGSDRWAGEKHGPTFLEATLRVKASHILGSPAAEALHQDTREAQRVG